jgi:hypothetical protein
MVAGACPLALHSPHVSPPRPAHLTSRAARAPRVAAASSPECTTSPFARSLELRATRVVPTTHPPAWCCAVHGQPSRAPHSPSHVHLASISRPSRVHLDSISRPSQPRNPLAISVCPQPRTQSASEAALAGTRGLGLSSPPRSSRSLPWCMKTEVRLVEGGHDLPHMGWGPVGWEGA